MRTTLASHRLNQTEMTTTCVVLCCGRSTPMCLLFSEEFCVHTRMCSLDSLLLGARHTCICFIEKEKFSSLNKGARGHTVGSVTHCTVVSGKPAFMFLNLVFFLFAFASDMNLVTPLPNRPINATCFVHPTCSPAFETRLSGLVATNCLYIGT